MRIFKFPHFDSLIHAKYTSNMAEWFYAQLNDVTSPQNT